ncbi:uncharacterized protein [Choristoneura fumiferana]|uniref:uncharacterized protein n=1 Tax=Choristoneura fumiferana TaxID=7141 RepID=UPI003D15E362
MALFKNLRDVCIAFEEDLRNVSPQLFTAKIGVSFETEIANKMQDFSLFTAKLRLLQAKSSSMTQPATELSEEATLEAYEDTATWKIIEQQTVKTVTQFRDVRELITTPNSKLDPGLVDRKDSIIAKLKEYRLKEEQLREMDSLLKKAESEHHTLRTQWDQELGELRDLKEQAQVAEEEMGIEDPLYSKLQVLIGKMEIMRWLISRLVTARTPGYDWLADPDNRLAALKIARDPNTVESFTGL